MLLVAFVRHGCEKVEIRFHVAAGFVVLNALHFPFADAVDQIAGLHGAVTQTNIAKGCASGRLLITAIVDRKLFGVAEGVNVFSEHADAERVERGDDRSQFELLSDQLQSTLPHFLRGLVGECHG